MKVLIFATHPIQYQAPVYQELSGTYDLKVYFLLQQTAEGQSNAGFGVKFDWDVPLTEGYSFDYLKNRAKLPSTSHYNGVEIDKQQLKDIYERDAPQVVIVNGWFPKAMKQIAVFFKSKGVVVICRGDSNMSMTSSPLKRIAKELYIRFVLKEIDYFLYVGKANKSFYKHYGVSETRLYPAVHSINTPLFEAAYQKGSPDKKLGKGIKLGFVGKLIPKKEPLFLLDAIAKSSFKRQIELVVIGDGPLKDALLQKASQLDIDLSFVGFLNQSKIVEEGYQLLDALVLPSSSNETWGLVVNEIMTGGMPVIVSDKVGCHVDLVVEGQTGYVFKSGDLSGLARCLDLLGEKLMNGYDFSQSVKKQIAYYSLSKTVSGYIHLLDSLHVKKKST